MDNFKTHKNIVHGKKKEMWSCFKCEDSWFSKKSNLAKHAKRFHTRKEFKLIMKNTKNKLTCKMKKNHPCCVKCQKSFQNEVNLVVHMKLYHNGIVYSDNDENGAFGFAPTINKCTNPVSPIQSPINEIDPVYELVEQMDQEQLPPEEIFYHNESTDDQFVQQSDETKKSSSTHNHYEKDVSLLAEKSLNGLAQNKLSGQNIDHRNFKEIRENVYPSSEKLIQSADFHECRCEREYECGDNCLNRLIYTECDPMTCPCGDKCRNIKIQKTMLRQWNAS